MCESSILRSILKNNADNRVTLAHEEVYLYAKKRQWGNAYRPYGKSLIVSSVIRDYMRIGGGGHPTGDRDSHGPHDQGVQAKNTLRLTANTFETKV